MTANSSALGSCRPSGTACGTGVGGEAAGTPIGRRRSAAVDTAPRYRVAVLAAEAALGDAVVDALGAEGYEVEALTALDALNARVAEGDVSLVVLDLSVARSAGFAVIRDLRVACGAPILLLAERGPTLDRIRGLAAGADDYVFKPLSRSELVWRVRAVLARARPSDRNR